MGSTYYLLLLGFLVGRMWAGTAVVTDFFNVSGNSDAIGNKLQFDAQSIQVSTGPGSMTIDVRTNFDNSALHSFRETGIARLDIGDLFFTVNGTYSYGIPLAYHNGPAGGPWGDRLYAGHVYAIDDQGALLTARQTLHNPMYVDYRPDAIVWMVDLGGVHDVTVGTPMVQVLPIDDNDGVNGALYVIRVTTSLPSGLFSLPGNTYGLEFTTSTGGNDVVEGNLIFNSGFQLRSAAASPVPEPSTWYMVIGALLVGMARLAVRRG
jgi:hypothetical protein